jgi:hypothetical protein
MTHGKNQIPGIEILTPTIFSAKNAARDFIDGQDNRSPIGLLKDLAVAYLSVPGAEKHEEAHIGAYGRKKPRINPWRNDYMRVKSVSEVAFETEAGPIGIMLSEQSDAYRRRFKPAVRRLGEFAFMESNAEYPHMFEALTILRTNDRGRLCSDWVNLSSSVEVAGESASFIDTVFGPQLVEMLAFPDDPIVITPYPAELRKS